jgi:hypothetical protein
MFEWKRTQKLGVEKTSAKVGKSRIVDVREDEKHLSKLDEGAHAYAREGEPDAAEGPH